MARGLTGAVLGTLLGRAARGPTARTPAGFGRGLAEDAVAAGLALVRRAAAAGRGARTA